MSIQLREHYIPSLSLFLALPPDWQEVQNPQVKVMYIGGLEQGYVPSLGIEVWRMKDPTPESYQEAAAVASAKMQARGISTQLIELKIDGFPAKMCNYRWLDESSGLRAVQQQLFLQINDTLFSFIFSLSETLAEKYLPVFEDVVKSIRFLRQPLNSSWVDVVSYKNLESLGNID